MKNRLASLALVPAVMLLAGCGISAGTVSNKAVEPAHTSTYSSCHKIGKVRSCHPVTTRVPERYCFDITAEDDHNHICLDDKDKWENISAGGYYDADATQ